MKGDGARQFPLSGLSMMRMENDTVWKNVSHTGDADHKVWLLTRATNVRYRAICEYDEEVIGVAVDASFQRCWLERKAGTDGVTTWCEA